MAPSQLANLFDSLTKRDEMRRDERTRNTLTEHYIRLVSAAAAFEKERRKKEGKKTVHIILVVFGLWPVAADDDDDAAAAAAAACALRNFHARGGRAGGRSIQTRAMYSGAIQGKQRQQQPILRSSLRWA